METISIIVLGVTIVGMFIIYYLVWRKTEQIKQLIIKNHKSLKKCELSHHYQELMSNMPKEPFTNEAASPIVKTYLTLYFNLCRDRYYLYSKGEISKEIWDVWVENMKRTTQSQIYKNGWKQNSSDYDQSFISFMNSEILK